MLQSRQWDKYASSLCMFFGLLLLLFLIGPGDGLWQLYANEILNGKRLYSDLLFNQQPLFPILYSIIISLTSLWLFEKIFLFLIVFFYVYYIYRICKISPIKEAGLRAIIILSCFFIMIYSPIYRFDDYTPFTHLCILMSMYYSIQYINKDINVIKYGVISAVIFSVCFFTRMVEGCVIFFSVFFIILYINKFNKYFIFVLIFGMCIFLLFLFAIVLFLNEDMFTYIYRTIFSAASIKGADSGFYPAKMIQESFLWICIRKWYYWVYIGIGVGLVIRGAIIYQKKCAYVRWFYIYIISIYTFLCIKWVWKDPIATITVFTIFSVVSIAVITILKSVENGGFLKNKFVLLGLYSFFWYFFTAFASAGMFSLQYQGVAFFIFALLFFNVKFSCGLNDFFKKIVYVFLVCISIYCMVGRFLNPYEWHHYKNPPIFTGYKVVSDKHGTYLISKDLYNLVEPARLAIKGDSLLSIPFPFLNFYTGIPQYKGYVQSFFDLASNEQIERMIYDLQNDPPVYIFYQRQLDNLGGHEVMFNHSKPLAQRKLDEIIMEKIIHGQWRVIYASNEYSPSTWYLIKTQTQN